MADYHNYKLEVASSLPEELQLKAAEMLCKEWPSGGDVNARLAHFSSKNSEYNQDISYILLRTSDQSLIGHVEIKPAVKISSNDTIGQDVCNGILLSVITHPSVRGTGFGRVLLYHVEIAAILLKYAYLYLWTTDSVGFYEKSGYHRCESTSIDSSVLKKIDVATFENLLLKRLSLLSSSPSVRANVTSSSSASDSSSAANTNITQSNSQWLRKRLLYTMPVSMPPETQFHESILTKLKSILNLPTNNTDELIRLSTNLQYIRSMPICRQIGPSCGVATLTMLCEYYRSMFNLSTVNINTTGESDIVPLDSEWLLRRAIVSGYSMDGELFNIHHMCALMNQWIDTQIFNKTTAMTITATATATATTAEAIVGSSIYEIDTIYASVCKCAEIFKYNHWQSMFDHPSQSKSDVSPPNKINDKFTDKHTDNDGEWKNMRHVIFPYDRTLSDNSPGFFTGHQAHYALLLGTCCYNSASDSSTSINTTNDDSKDNNVDDEEIRNKTYLICTHGMSVNPVIAPLNLWLTSNAQLYHIRPGAGAQHWVVDSTVGPQLAGLCVVVTVRYRIKL